MIAPKSSNIVTMAGILLLVFVGYHPVGLAGPWMSMFMDTGVSDTGSVTDDTSSPESTDDTSTPEPADDTSTPDLTDDTGTPPDEGDDTGSSVETGEAGDSGDTGETPDDMGGEDTGPSGQSAAELAGEKGGCGCAAGSSPASGFVWLGALVMAARRRR